MLSVIMPSVAMLRHAAPQKVLETLQGSAPNDWLLWDFILLKISRS
jgi:hypothetical protein